MMRVMNMQVFVLQLFVLMAVTVTLAQEQHHAGRHE